MQTSCVFKAPLYGIEMQTDMYKKTWPTSIEPLLSDCSPGPLATDTADREDHFDRLYNPSFGRIHTGSDKPPKKEMKIK